MTIEDLPDALRDAVAAQRPASANARQEVARRVVRQRRRILAAVAAPALVVGVVTALAWPTSPRSVRLATRPPNATLAPTTSPSDRTTTSKPLGSTTTTAAPSTTAPPATVTSIPLVLKPPDSLYPAAGICGATTEGAGYVTFEGGDNVPMPRCLVVRHDERFGVTNTSGFTITAAVGTSYRWTLAPGESHLFSVPVGNRLAPGVHRLALTQNGNEVSSADLWVDPVCTGPGPSGCSTRQ